MRQGYSRYRGGTPTPRSDGHSSARVVNPSQSPMPSVSIDIAWMAVTTRERASPNKNSGRSGLVKQPLHAAHHVEVVRQAVKVELNWCSRLLIPLIDSPPSGKRAGASWPAYPIRRQQIESSRSASTDRRASMAEPRWPVHWAPCAASPPSFFAFRCSRKPARRSAILTATSSVRVPCWPSSSAYTHARRPVRGKAPVLATWRIMLWRSRAVGPMPSGTWLGRPRTRPKKRIDGSAKPAGRLTDRLLS